MLDWLNKGTETMRMEMLPGTFMLKDFDSLISAVKPSLSEIDKPNGIGILRHGLPRLYAYGKLNQRTPVRTQDGTNLVDDPTTGEKGKWPSAWFEMFNLILNANDWGVARLTAQASVHGWADEHDLRAKCPPTIPNIWHEEIVFWRS